MTESSGAKGRSGTKVFLSIGLLLQGDNQSRQPHSFMDDLRSSFGFFFGYAFTIAIPTVDGSDQKNMRNEIFDLRTALLETKLGLL